MKFSGKTIGLVAGAAATLMCLEPVTLSGKIACVIIGGGSGAKFGETCEEEFMRIKINAQAAEIERLKAQLQGA